MQMKIVDSKPWHKDGETVGTIYTVFLEDENGSEFVEVNVEGDNNSLADQLGVNNEVDTSGDVPTFTKIDDDSAERLELRQLAAPDAYAALIRLYLEWMEMSKDEQLEHIYKNTEFAGKLHKKYTGIVSGSFKNTGDELYGEDFSSYASTAFISLGNGFENVDQFAEELLSSYLKCKPDKRKFPMSGDILRKSAGRHLQSSRKEWINSSDAMSLDFTGNDDDGNSSNFGNLIPDKTTDVEGAVLQKEDLSFEDLVSLVREQIKDARTLQVFDSLIKKEQKIDIASKLGIAPSQVSREVKKIGAIMIPILNSLR